MKLLKKLARKILKDELKEQKQEHDKLYSEYLSLSTEYSESQKKYAANLNTTYENIKTLDDRNKQLEEESIILRKYYHLDEEPSEDIQLKIRTNLKIHELETQILNMRIDLQNVLTTMNALHPLPQYQTCATALNYYPYLFWGRH